MSHPLTENERLVQIGVTALRGPDGKPLPSVPMYIVVHADQISAKSGLTSSEESACTDFAGLMAGRFGEYMRGVRGLAQ